MGPCADPASGQDTAREQAFPIPVGHSNQRQRVGSRSRRPRGSPRNHRQLGSQPQIPERRKEARPVTLRWPWVIAAGRPPGTRSWGREPGPQGRPPRPSSPAAVKQGFLPQRQEAFPRGVRCPASEAARRLAGEEGTHFRARVRGEQLRPQHRREGALSCPAAAGPPFEL